MLRRMVLSGCRTVPWLALRILFHELLNLKSIQLESRLNLKTYWTGRSIWRCRKMQAWFPSGVIMLHFRDEQDVKYNTAGAQLHSGHLLL
jgi:hypothetical protein